MTYENDEHKRVVGSIHSHPGISTNPSCTDDEDECELDGLHFIVNPLEHFPHGINAHATVNGTRFRFDPEYVLTDLPAPDDSVPQEWLAKVDVPDTSLSEPLTEFQERLLQDELFTFSDL